MTDVDVRRVAKGRGDVPQLVVRVRRLAQPNVAERLGQNVADPHDPGRFVPAFVPEVPRELDVGRGRAGDEGDEPVVACRLDDDPDRTEPVAERLRALEKRRHPVEPRQRQLDGELEPVRHRLRPALELILTRQPVPGRIQLDGREPLGVEAEELSRLQTLRVETRPPRRIRPA